MQIQDEDMSAQKSFRRKANGTVQNPPIMKDLAEKLTLIRIFQRTLSSNTINGERDNMKMNRKRKLKRKEKKTIWKKYENPWRRKIDLVEISSDDESDNDSWNGIYQTDLDKQASKRGRKLPSKIIKDVNKMTTQHERFLDEMSNHFCHRLLCITIIDLHYTTTILKLSLLLLS